MVANTPAPVPDKLSASAPTVMPPLNSRAAPADTVVPLAIVPSAVLFEALNTPSLIKVEPV